MWWHVPVIPAIGRLKQENSQLEGSLGYVVRLFKKKRKKRNNLSKQRCMGTNFNFSMRKMAEFQEVLPSSPYPLVRNCSGRYNYTIVLDFIRTFIITHFRDETRAYISFVHLYNCLLSALSTGNWLRVLGRLVKLSLKQKESWQNMVWTSLISLQKFLNVSLKACPGQFHLMSWAREET